MKLKGKMMICALMCISGALAAEAAGIVLKQGEVWPDSEGNHINVHGGCVLKADSLYYWYGEIRPNRGFTMDRGVGCYVSPDLVNWRSAGSVLTLSDTPGADIEKGCIIERPKVVYNPKTGKYVMWFHLELKRRGYAAARAGVAVSDSPEGPFEFIGSGRVNPGIWPENMPQEDRDATITEEGLEGWTPEWKEAVARGLYTHRDFEGGQMSRDMTIFVDDDGKAYHVYSSEENLTLQIAELSDDYTSHTGRYIRIFPAGHNEAPAVFKHDGRYWMITSGCTGWAPNEARLMTATDMLGEWTQLPNPCVGPNSDKTFGGQSNYVLAIPGAEPRYIAMFDEWHPRHLSDSRHIWIPVTFGADGIPQIIYTPEFK